MGTKKNLQFLRVYQPFVQLNIPRFHIQYGPQFKKGEQTPLHYTGVLNVCIKSRGRSQWNMIQVWNLWMEVRAVSVVFLSNLTETKKKMLAHYSLLSCKVLTWTTGMDLATTVDQNIYLHLNTGIETNNSFMVFSFFIIIYFCYINSYSLSNLASTKYSFFTNFMAWQFTNMFLFTQLIKLRAKSSEPQHYWVFLSKLPHIIPLW